MGEPLLDMSAEATEADLMQAIEADTEATEADLVQIMGEEPRLATTDAQRDIEIKVRREAIAQGLDPDLAASVAYHESKFDPAALSHTGAPGVMQVTGIAARDVGMDPGLVRRDLDANIRAGVMYLKKRGLDKYPEQTPSVKHPYIKRVLGTVNQLKLMNQPTPERKILPQMSLLPVEAEATEEDLIRAIEADSQNASTPAWVDDVMSGKTKIDDGNGTIHTILSGIFEADGKAFLYPGIRVIDGKAVKLEPGAARDYAIKQGDSLPFNSVAEAKAWERDFHKKEYTRLGTMPTATSASALGLEGSRQATEEDLLKAIAADSTGAQADTEATEADLLAAIEQDSAPPQLSFKERLLSTLSANPPSEAISTGSKSLQDLLGHIVTLPQRAAGVAGRGLTALSSLVEGLPTTEGGQSLMEYINPQNLTENVPPKPILDSSLRGDTSALGGVGAGLEKSLEYLAPFLMGRGPQPYKPGLTPQSAMTRSDLEFLNPTKVPSEIPGFMRRITPETPLPKFSFAESPKALPLPPGSITHSDSIEWASMPKSSRVLSDEVAAATEEFAAAERTALDVGKRYAKDNAFRRLYRASVGDIRNNILKAEPDAAPVVAAMDKGAAARATMKDESTALLGDSWADLEKLARKKPAEYAVSRRRIINALQDRTNSLDHLKTKLESDIYAGIVKVLDRWSGRILEGGGAVRSNYYTHILDNQDKPLQALRSRLPKEYQSGFEKPRTRDAPYSEDLLTVIPRYIDSMSRSFAYKEAVEAYNALESTGAHPATGEVLSSVLYPSGKSVGIIGKLLARRFDTNVRWDLFLSAENRFQPLVARAQADPKVGRLFEVVRKNSKDLGLDSLIKEGFMGRQQAIDSVDLTSSKLPWYDKKAFLGGEKINWEEARSIGVAEEVVSSPIYKEALSRGLSKVQAIKEVLKNPESVVNAGKRARAYAMNTQLGNEPGLRTPLVEATNKVPGLKPLFQFTRYGTGALEAAINSLTKEGRELIILSKGIPAEASIVARIRTIRLTLKGADKAVKLYKNQPDLLKGMPELREKLGAELKVLEPLAEKIPQGTTMNAVYQLAKMFGGAFLIKGSKKMLKFGLKKAGVTLSEDKDKDITGADVVGGVAGHMVDSTPASGAFGLAKKLAGVNEYPETTTDWLIENGLLLTPAWPAELIPGKPLSTLLKKGARVGIKGVKNAFTK